MLQKTLRLFLGLLILWAALGASSVNAEPTYDLSRLYQEVRQVVRTHYPKASSHLLGRKIHFEDNTRIFLVHEALKTGEWQDPSEERGPKLNGIWGEMVIQPGEYRGAAELPTRMNKRYFLLYVQAPYAQTIDAHLHVRIKTPQKVPDGFLKDLDRVLQKFGEDVTLK